jgi:hypothetical protein
MCPEELINNLLDRAASGQISDEEMATLKQYALDPGCMDFVLAGMKARGLDQVGSEPLRPIADYYVEGPGTYELQWPLSPELPLPVPFEVLDRKTRFFVLFGEWTRREMEGMEILNRGQCDGAQMVFEECLGRAEQLGVAELAARSYEGLMRVAERRGRGNEARRFSQKAVAARRQG